MAIAVEKQTVTLPLESASVYENRVGLLPRGQHFNAAISETMTSVLSALDQAESAAEKLITEAQYITNESDWQLLALKGPGQVNGLRNADQMDPATRALIELTAEKRAQRPQLTPKGWHLRAQSMRDARRALRVSVSNRNGASVNSNVMNLIGSDLDTIKNLPNMTAQDRNGILIDAARAQYDHSAPSSAVVEAVVDYNRQLMFPRMKGTSK